MKFTYCLWKLTLTKPDLIAVVLRYSVCSRFICSINQYLCTVFFFKLWSNGNINYCNINFRFAAGPNKCVTRLKSILFYISLIILLRFPYCLTSSFLKCTSPLLSFKTNETISEPFYWQRSTKLNCFEAPSPFLLTLNQCNVVAVLIQLWLTDNYQKV